MGMFILIFVGAILLLAFWKEMDLRKEKKQKEAEDKTKQAELVVRTEELMEVKRVADAYTYTKTQQSRLEMLRKFAHASREIDDIKSTLLMVIGNGDIGIFYDEVLPSQAMKDKYHLLPMSRKEFKEKYPFVVYRQERKTYTALKTHDVYVPGKQKSVVGGAVKGAIIAGGVGAVVGAVATADKNAHAKGHYTTRQTGGGFINLDPHFHAALVGECINEQSQQAEAFAYCPKQLWIHAAVLDKYIINGSRTFSPAYMQKHGKVRLPLSYGRDDGHRSMMIEFTVQEEGDYSGHSLETEDTAAKAIEVINTILSR